MTASADLRQLLAEATPGPWRDISDETDEERAWILSVPEGARLYVTPRPLNVNDDGMLDADAALIVWLVNHAPALADLIDAAEAMKTNERGVDHAWWLAHADLYAALSALEGNTDD